MTLPESASGVARKKFLIDEFNRRIKLMNPIKIESRLFRLMNDDLLFNQYMTSAMGLIRPALRRRATFKDKKDTFEEDVKSYRIR